MASYTNTGLVSYCKQALSLKTKYMWGGLMRTITEGYISMLSGPTMYPSQYPESRKTLLRSCIGKGYYGCDCVGLIKSYYFGGIGSPDYKNANDYNVGTMYSAAKVKGKLDTLPETPGVLVMTSNLGHVGVCIGNGEVIECTLGSRGDGVVKTKLQNGGWYYWCECPVIEYPSSKAILPKVQTTTNIYLSLGKAAKRKGASNSATKVGTCEKGAYYLASQLVTNSDGRVWFRHYGTDLYSALTDIPSTGNSKLFEQFGTYTETK